MCLSILRIQIVRRLGDISLSEEQKRNIFELEAKLASEVKKLGLKLGDPRELAKQRRKAVLAKCFHKIGIVVPYDETTELGYRPLPLSDSKIALCVHVCTFNYNLVLTETEVF